MSDFLLVAPEGWELCTPEMLQRAIDGTGDIVNVQSLIDAGQLGELASYIDEVRFTLEQILEALLVRGSLWIRTGPA